MKKWSFNRNNARRYTETTSAVFQSHSCQKNHLYCNSFFSPKKFVKIQKARGPGWGGDIKRRVLG